MKLSFTNIFYFIILILLSSCTTAELAVDLVKKSKKKKQQTVIIKDNDNNISKKNVIPKIKIEKDNQITSLSTKLKPNPRYKIGDPYEINSIWYYPERDLSYDQTGIASWYGDEFAGKMTANGEIFDPDLISAAHKTLPMPSVVRVTNLENGKSLIIRINDRGPFVAGRIIDLSKEAARLIGFKNRGIARVRVQILPEQSIRLEKLAKNGSFPFLNNKKQILPKINVEKKPSVSIVAKTTRASSNKPQPQKTAIELINEAKIPKVVYSNPVETKIWIQVGAFHNKNNAEKLVIKLNEIFKGETSEFLQNGKIIHRVRLGPIENVNNADKLLNKVFNKGFEGAKIIVD